MKQYADLLRKIVRDGLHSDDRTGVGTTGLFGEQIRIDMSEGFPLVTGKETNFAAIREELRWFLSGSTNANELDSKIWDSWRRPYSIYRDTVEVNSVVLDPVPCIVEGKEHPKTLIGILWHNMMEHAYSNGMSVCKAWQDFDTFEQDVKKVPHWWYAERSWGVFSLSLEYYKSNVYSPETCVWLHVDELEEMKLMPDTLRFKLIEDGDVGPVYGRQWRNWNDSGIDQISALVAGLKNHPASRRHVVSAWNVEELDEMGLPCCHILFQCYVRDGRLSLHMYQRSADMFLGVPFNIASYGLLLELLAHECGLEAGELILTFGDCHIYDNHMEAVATYLGRGRHPLPTLKVLGVNFASGFFDVQLIDYSCGAPIKAKVAV